MSALLYRREGRNLRRERRSAKQRAGDCEARIQALRRRLNTAEWSDEAMRRMFGQFLAAIDLRADADEKLFEVEQRCMRMT